MENCCHFLKDNKAFIHLGGNDGKSPVILNRISFDKCREMRTICGKLAYLEITRDSTLATE